MYTEFFGRIAIDATADQFDLGLTGHIVIECVDVHRIWVNSVAFSSADRLTEKGPEWMKAAADEIALIRSAA